MWRKIPATESNDKFVSKVIVSAVCNCSVPCIVRKDTLEYACPVNSGREYPLSR